MIRKEDKLDVALNKHMKTTIEILNQTECDDGQPLLGERDGGASEHHKENVVVAYARVGTIDVDDKKSQ